VLLRGKNRGRLLGGQSGSAVEKHKEFILILELPLNLSHSLWHDLGIPESPFPAAGLCHAVNALLTGLGTGDPKIHNGLGLWPVFANCMPSACRGRIGSVPPSISPACGPAGFTYTQSAALKC
jgi:hypothetical protein